MKYILRVDVNLQQRSSMKLILYYAGAKSADNSQENLIGATKSDDIDELDNGQRKSKNKMDK